MLKLERVEEVIKETESLVDSIKSMSDTIVSSFTGDLDEIMREVNTYIISSDNVTDEIIEKYFLELTNALYFIGAKCESLGFYEDIAKSSAKVKYNKAYSDNQLFAYKNNVKTTVAENTIFAENNSINETIVSYLYSRSFKIVKSKIELANEMIKTLSKIMTKRINEFELSKLKNSQNFNGLGVLTETNPFNK